jgi:hypothetical protein
LTFVFPQALIVSPFVPANSGGGLSKFLRVRLPFVQFRSQYAGHEMRFA